MLKRLSIATICLVGALTLAGCSSSNANEKDSSSSKVTSLKKVTKHSKSSQSSQKTSKQDSSNDTDASSTTASIPASEDQGMSVLYTMYRREGYSDDSITESLQNKQLSGIKLDEISGKNAAYDYNKSVTRVFPENTYLVFSSMSAAGSVTFQLVNNHTAKVYAVPSHFQDERWLTDDNWAQNEVNTYMNNPQTWELQTPSADLLNLMKTTQSSY